MFSKDRLWGVLSEVLFGRRTEKWVIMKQSSVQNGRFGIFACRSFYVGEFITVCLGEMIPLQYHFENIVAIQQ